MKKSELAYFLIIVTILNVHFLWFYSIPLASALADPNCQNKIKINCWQFIIGNMKSTGEIKLEPTKEKIRNKNIERTLPFNYNVLVVTKFENLFKLLWKLPKLCLMISLEHSNVSSPVLLEVQLHAHARPAKGTIWNVTSFLVMESNQLWPLLPIHIQNGKQLNEAGKEKKICIMFDYTSHYLLTLVRG